MRLELSEKQLIWSKTLSNTDEQDNILIYYTLKVLFFSVSFGKNIFLYF